MLMYEELADWWPLISGPEEYVEEAAEYLRLLRGAARAPLVEVLELGSGGGNNAVHMKKDLRLTLVEPAAGMRAHSVALNPECEHVEGDMRTVRLGRTFDAVFVHDAVCYMTTEADLRAALETVAIHLRPGGLALIAPDHTTETFEAGTAQGGLDGADGRAVRWLEWCLPPAPGATTYTVHYAFLLRDPEGNVRSAHDVHAEGLFPGATWLRLLREVGLDGWVERRVIEGVSGDVLLARRGEASR